MVAEENIAARPGPDVSVQFVHDASAPARVRQALASLVAHPQDSGQRFGGRSPATTLTRWTIPSTLRRSSFPSANQ